MRPRTLTSWPFFRAQSRIAPACSRSIRPPPPVARERPAPEARPLLRPLTLRAAETYLPKTSRISWAFLSDRSISYVVPSSANVTVSSAGMLSSRSSLRITWTLRAIVCSLLLLRARRPLPLSALFELIAPQSVAFRPMSLQRARGETTRRGELLVQRAHQGEQDRLPDAQSGERHHEPVHAEAHAAGGRHPVLECLQEVLVEHHRL